MLETEKMILAAEAAKRLHVTTRTVQRWVKKGVVVRW
ncbi:MAG: helix-turn-helix domain-containing protein [Ardenticatenaceae bacterium]|nr:helix-turn-helix domain-containing protein [Ardenticatenaceae bacterium]